jgi:hypothetical protein
MQRKIFLTVLAIAISTTSIASAGRLSKTGTAFKVVFGATPATANSPATGNAWQLRVEPTPTAESIP